MSIKILTSLLVLFLYSPLFSYENGEIFDTRQAAEIALKNYLESPNSYEPYGASSINKIFSAPAAIFNSIGSKKLKANAERLRLDQSNRVFICTSPLPIGLGIINNLSQSRHVWLEIKDYTIDEDNNNWKVDEEEEEEVYVLKEEIRSYGLFSTLEGTYNGGDAYIKSPDRGRSSSRNDFKCTPVYKLRGLSNQRFYEMASCVARKVSYSHARDFLIKDWIPVFNYDWNQSNCSMAANYIIDTIVGMPSQSPNLGVGDTYNIEQSLPIAYLNSKINIEEIKSIIIEIKSLIRDYTRTCEEVTRDYASSKSELDFNECNVKSLKEQVDVLTNVLNGHKENICISNYSYFEEFMDLVSRYSHLIESNSSYNEGFANDLYNFYYNLNSIKIDRAFRCRDDSTTFESVKNKIILECSQEIRSDI